MLATADIRAQLLLGRYSQKTSWHNSKKNSETNHHMNDHESVNDSYISPIRALFYQIITFFAKTYADVFALTNGPPLHDPIAVAAAFDSFIFGEDTGERYKVKIVTEGSHSTDQGEVGQLGRTVVTQLPNGSNGVRIPKSIDLGRFWDHIESAITKSEGHSRMVPISKELRSSLMSSLAITSNN